jgi:hypothetical protein
MYYLAKCGSIIVRRADIKTLSILDPYDEITILSGIFAI